MSRTPVSSSSGRAVRHGRIATYCAVITAMHVVGFGALWLVIEPQDLHVGTQVVGIGLGVTTYLLGVRHAFDADHIAVIDNTTRKLMSDGHPAPSGVGFWFAIGHSTVVAVMTALVALGVRAASSTMTGENSMSEWLGLAGTLTSAFFLVAVGLLNLHALQRIWGVFRRMRSEGLDEAELERHLEGRGLLLRVLGPINRGVRNPVGLFPVGLVMGLGFDTASEVALLVLAGSGAASGLPWYAVMVLPLIFAAGMTLFDFADGVLMTRAYRWAFTRPVRKVYYNLTVTGLSVAVAFIIGGIELVGVLHERLGWSAPVVDDIAAVDLGSAGYIVAATFVVVWLGAVAYWKLARVEERWGAPLT